MSVRQLVPRAGERTFNGVVRNVRMERGSWCKRSIVEMTLVTSTGQASSRHAQWRLYCALHQLKQFPRAMQPNTGLFLSPSPPA
jgi:hypothetical protein